MEMRRRRADEKPAAGAESHGADGAVSSGAGCSGADGGAEQRPAADGAAGIVEETAIIGQELVPVAKVSEKGLSDELLQVEAVSKSFQTPENQKTMGSPERLQLENKADLKTNEDSEKKGEGEDKGQMVAVPNGPPVSYGPDSAVSMPLFTPDQIAQCKPMIREIHHRSCLWPGNLWWLLNFLGYLGFFMAYFLVMNSCMKYDSANWNGARRWRWCSSNLDSNCVPPKMKTYGWDKNFKTQKEGHLAMEPLKKCSLWEKGMIMQFFMVWEVLVRRMG